MKCAYRARTEQMRFELRLNSDIDRVTVQAIVIAVTMCRFTGPTAQYYLSFIVLYTCECDNASRVEIETWSAHTSTPPTEQTNTYTNARFGLWL